MSQLVLLRHGQSEWNQENRFTGWMDVRLTRQGAAQARSAGQFLREAGFSFDVSFTSLLKRAIRSTWIVLDVLDQAWLPVEKTWRLNERHYGALQGLDKAEIAARYGKEQVFLWRRSYDIRPPALDWNDPRHPHFDSRYAGIDPHELPSTESLKDTLERVMPFWQDAILPRLRRQERVMVVAHGNSLRALIKHLDGIPDNEIPRLNVPLGIPIVYEINAQGEPGGRYYLGDEETIREATSAASRAAQV